MTRFIGTLVLVLAVRAAAAPAAETWHVEVRETAGIQRFKYPLGGEFHADGAGAAFELRDGGKPIPAQFTRLAEAQPGHGALWSVDFAIDLVPLEARELSIHRRAMARESSRPKRGLTVQRSDGKIRVRHPSLQFVVPEDLGGLLDRIVVSGDDWLAAGSPGLVMQLRDGSEVPLWRPSANTTKQPVRVVKSGPLAVRLEFVGRQELVDGSEAESVVVLDFPLGKSWIRVDWTLDDPADAVAAVGAGVRLRLEADGKQAVLADVGAGDWTYAALRDGETLAYRAGRPSRDTRNVWRVERVIGDAARPYVLPGRDGDGPAPQGWGHLMDRTRATAVAVDHFAEGTRDGIDLSSDGLIQLRREFAPRATGTRATTPKRFAFWLHVVNFPPQVGAATSPQSMLTPPEVRIVAVTDTAPSGN